MTRFDRQKLVEVVLYVLNKVGGIDYYHLFKILYFAELKHLAEWGRGIIPDKFHALPHGPVPTALYDAVKKDKREGELSKLLYSSVEFAGYDAPNVLLPKKPADLDYVSKSEMEALDASICENAKLTFGVLKEKSHDKAWETAFGKRGKKEMSSVLMAKVMGADDATISYIEEQLQLDMALN